MSELWTTIREYLKGHHAHMVHNLELNVLISGQSMVHNGALMKKLKILVTEIFRKRLQYRGLSNHHFGVKLKNTQVHLKFA